MGVSAPLALGDAEGAVGAACGAVANRHVEAAAARRLFARLTVGHCDALERRATTMATTNDEGQAPSEAAHHGGSRRPMAGDSYIRGRAAARAEAGRGGRGLERSRLFAEPGRELFVRLEALECELERWPKEVPGTTWRFWAS